MNSSEANGEFHFLLKRGGVAFSPIHGNDKRSYAMSEKYDHHRDEKERSTGAYTVILSSTAAALGYNVTMFFTFL